MGDKMLGEITKANVPFSTLGKTWFVHDKEYVRNNVLFGT